MCSLGSASKAKRQRDGCRAATALAIKRTAFEPCVEYGGPEAPGARGALGHCAVPLPPRSSERGEALVFNRRRVTAPRIFSKWRSNGHFFPLAQLDEPEQLILAIYLCGRSLSAASDPRSKAIFSAFESPRRGYQVPWSRPAAHRYRNFASHRAQGEKNAKTGAI